jgi:hypothetical protein
MSSPEARNNLGNKPKLSIEAGHLYNAEAVTTGHSGPDNFGESKPESREVLNSRIEQGIKIGSKIESILRKHDYEVVRIIFHDDVDFRMQQHDSRRDSWRYEMFLHRALFTAIDRTKLTSGSDIKAESEYRYIKPGMALIDEIKKQAESKEGWRVSEDGKKLVIGSGAKKQIINLMGFLEYDEVPSCEVLDMVAYLKKIWVEGITITVLPESYKAQQKRVQKLFELFGETPPVVVVYHDTNGEMSSIDEWAPTYTYQIKEAIEREVR